MLANVVVDPYGRNSESLQRLFWPNPRPNQHLGGSNRPGAQHGFLSCTRLSGSPTFAIDPTHPNAPIAFELQPIDGHPCLNRQSR